MKENSKYLDTEIYKILYSLSPEIMKGIFKTKANYYNTLNALIFSKRNVKTIRYGLQTMSYVGPKIWDLVSKEIKQVTILNKFKAKIKVWKLVNCPYTAQKNEVFH